MGANFYANNLTCAERRIILRRGSWPRSGRRGSAFAPHTVTPCSRPGLVTPPRRTYTHPFARGAALTRLGQAETHPLNLNRLVPA